MTDLPQTIARLRERALAVMALSDGECVTSAKNQTVCDYLAASNATDILQILDALESRGPASVVVDAPLIAAARAVINRWDTPLWKDVGPTADCINALRRCLAEHEKGKYK